MEKKESQCQTTRLRGRKGTRQQLKLVSPLKNVRRDLGERVNNCRKMRLLKGRDIGALVDGKRVAIVDDGCLSDRLGCYFEGEFHERSQQQRG